MGRAGSTVAPVLLFYTFQVCFSYTFHPTVLYTMDLQTNASKVVELTAKIKKLSDQLDSVKVELIAQMTSENVTQIQIKRQNVILCERKTKDYGPEINRQELELKAEKKKLETLGEFTISKVTNFIQVR
jgi:hypothetical protein